MLNFAVGRFSMPTLLLCALLGAAAGCSSPTASGGGTEPPPTGGGGTTPTPDPLRTLADRHSIRFGAAVGRLFPDDARFTAVLEREFSMLTPENDLKFDATEPARGQYRFTRADAMLDFAVSKGMTVRGHTLVWHNQLPAWLTSGSWTRDEAREIMENHIAALVGHYKGQLAAWDVVNEAIDDAGAPRAGFWLNTIGPDYIELAFRAARAADPDAALYYNDYSLEYGGAKTDAVYQLLSDLKGRGVPIDGIGFQAHFEAGKLPSLETMKSVFARFAALGLKIQITELDIRVPMPATAASLQTQAADYRTVVTACRETPACNAIVTWGVTDADSWVPTTFPGFGAPLLFDAAYAPKPAYTAVAEALK
jgi:endo-1,4-beta-xylanase